jgi:hypothetical protein
MAADFSFCHQPVIDIRASDVTLLGGNHRVDGNDAACITVRGQIVGGHFVFVSRVRLDGVDLRGCSGGAIVFEDVSSSVVDHATIRSNAPGILITFNSHTHSRT